MFYVIWNNIIVYYIMKYFLPKRKMWVICVLIFVLFLLLFLFLQTYNLRIETFELNQKKNMEGIDIVYWVNLDRSPERRELIEIMFSDPVFNDVPNHRFSAIDGKTVDVFSYFEPSEKENPKLNNVEY